MMAEHFDLTMAAFDVYGSYQNNPESPQMERQAVGLCPGFI